MRSFQIGPLIRFLTVQLPKMIRGLEATWSDSEFVVARGSYSYHFPTYLSRYASTDLLVRSKVVLDLSQNQVLRPFLYIDGFGFLPKPSNIWDLIPFSFVVNWITGIGANIRRMEYAIIGLLSSAYYVNTYALSCPLLGMDFLFPEVESDPASPLVLRWYKRDVSVYPVLPASNKYDFGVTPAVPSALTVGALLYQVLLA